MTWQNKIIGLTEESPEQLLAHYANARVHKGEQRDAMRASLDELGIIAPCTVNDRSGNMIDGHMRVEEYLSAGIKKIPIVHLDLSEEDELKALAYFDAVGTLGAYDSERLEGLLEQIDFVSEPLENLLTDLVDKKAKALPEDIDDIPEVKRPTSKLGDLWLLDGHRVLCGDSTDQATVERLMGGKKADMVFTDPPYGMNLDTDYSKLPSTKAQGNKTHKAVIGDNQPFNYQQFAWIQCKEQIWFGANYYAKTLPDEGSWLVWDKRVEEKFDRMFGSGFEIAWSKTPHKQKIYRHNNTLFGGDTEARGKEHPTQKPTKLLVEMMDDMFKGSKSVLDLFLGSGSTLIACEQTDRICYGLELDEHYVDVICKRWQTLTGTMPILESTGEAHDFLEG